MVSNPTITVICPAFNSESTIKKTISSLLDQEILDRGINIEILIIDDHSTDNTISLVQEFIIRNDSITLVSLKKNTGSPSTPRNIGIQLSRSPYIMFLDSDDYLDNEALSILYDILQKTGDDYVVGKTIELSDKGTRVIGEWQSDKERRSLSPFDIPHFFYHMGPVSRMMKTSIIKKNNIYFPAMRFAEDKSFFFDVLLCSKRVSTTTHVITYVNRYNSNNSSLTRTVSMLEKRPYDLALMRKIKEKHLPKEQEIPLMVRLFEYDILRKFKTKTFLKAVDKQPYFEILSEALTIVNDLSYNIRDYIWDPIHNIALTLFLQNRNEDFVELYRWAKNEKIKDVEFIDNNPCMVVPHLEAPLCYAPLKIYSLLDSISPCNNNIVLTINVYGDQPEYSRVVRIKDRLSYNNELLVLAEETGDAQLFVTLPFKQLQTLKPASYAIRLKHHSFRYATISTKENIELSFNLAKKTFFFYTTIEGNLGLKVSSINNAHNE